MLKRRRRRPRPKSGYAVSPSLPQCRDETPGYLARLLWRICLGYARLIQKQRRCFCFSPHEESPLHAHLRPIVHRSPVTPKAGDVRSLGVYNIHALWGGTMEFIETLFPGCTLADNYGSRQLVVTQTGRCGKNRPTMVQNS